MGGLPGGAGVLVFFGFGFGFLVLVEVGMGLGVFVGWSVGVRVLVAVRVSVLVGVCDGANVAVDVFVAVSVRIGVEVILGLGVLLAMFVFVTGNTTGRVSVLLESERPEIGLIKPPLANTTPLRTMSNAIAPAKIHHQRGIFRFTAPAVTPDDDAPVGVCAAGFGVLSPCSCVAIFAVAAGIATARGLSSSTGPEIACSSALSNSMTFA